MSTSLAVEPESMIRCSTLACSLRARICVLRQLASDRQRTRDTWRGQGSEFTSCVTARCEQGRAVREAIEGARLAWRGEGPGHRWAPRRNDLAAQEAAKRKLLAVGLLDEEPTMDETWATEDGERVLDPKSGEARRRAA